MRRSRSNFNRVPQVRCSLCGKLAAKSNSVSIRGAWFGPGCYEKGARLLTESEEKNADNK